MASYPAPTESFIGIIYNPLFFNRINLSDYVTYGYVQQNFLSRVGVATSIASLTTFSGAVTILGVLTLSGGLSLTGGLTVDTLRVNSTSLFIGIPTFTVIPILPAGFQFITTSSQTLTGLKIFTSVLTTAGINDSLSITSPTITGSTIVNGGTFNATNIAGTSSFYGISILGTATFNNFYPTTTLGDNLSINTSQFATVGYVNSNGGAALLSSANTWTNTNLFAQLVTYNNGLFVNGGDINTPNNAILGTTFCDQFNNYNQTTGTDITLNPNNFVQMVVNAANNSVLPTSPIGYGGLKIGWNCSNSIGETDFINLANYTNTGGFNFYTMNASTVPSLIGSLSPSALTITGSLTNNRIINSSATLPYHIKSGQQSLPTTTTGDPRDGFLIGWNGLSGSAGETDFTNLNQGGNQGGFLFGNIPVGSSYQKLVQISPLNGTGLRVYSQCGQLQLDDRNSGAFNTIITQGGNQSFYTTAGINTQIVLQCANAAGVISNTMAINTTTLQPFVNFSPASTTTFNASHPTTTLPAPTLSNQYATVGYVSSVVNPNLLPLNNTWTGTNLFRNSTGGITTSLTATLINNYFGCGAGSALNIVIGGPSLPIVNASNTTNIAICPTPNQSLQNNIGNNNIAIGNASGNTQTSANRNIYIGAQCGTAVTGSNNICIGGSAGVGITTGSNNIAIGDTAWSGANTFSNCTVIGAGALQPDASNQIVLGRTADTVLIRGGSIINDTLLTGTTVVSNNLQVNGNIILPLTISSAGVNTTYTSIPPYIIFLPTAGMSFTLPAPSGANTGQEFVIRRYGVGGGQTIIFNCVGNLAVWVPANSGPTGATTLAVSTTWQFRFVSTGVLFLQIS